MELGLHRRDVHCHLLRDEKQRTGISAIIWSIVILDRQWSAANGLPQNFQESDFDQSIEPPVSHLILRPEYDVGVAQRPIFLLTSDMIGGRMVPSSDDLVHIHESEVRSTDTPSRCRCNL